MAVSIQAKKLWEASEQGSLDLLKEMKKIKGSKKTHEDLPDIVAGAACEDLIVEEFRQMYQNLYNSCDSSDNQRKVETSRGLLSNI